jgi:polyisoprenoid-binding protein YceI
VTWYVDRDHSTVEFSVQHLLVSTVHGWFDDWDATIVLDADAPTRSRVVAAIDSRSLRTDNADRDAHLRSAAFLDVQQFPSIRFESRQVARLGEHGVWVRGDLTIRGVTREVLLDGNLRGPAPGVDGHAVLDLVLVIAIDPQDYLGALPDLVELFVGRTVLITITTRLRDTEAAAEA